MSRVGSFRVAFWLMVAVIGWFRTDACDAETPETRTPSGAAANGALKQSVHAEQIRNTCIEGRRIICGRVLQVTTNGLVIDSGYRQLLDPPLNQNWVAPKTAVLSREANAVEEQKPGAICVGIVFLSNIPKRPKVGLYDYVTLHGYPAGYHNYVPVPGIEKKIRCFSASLERACEANAVEPGNPVSAGRKSQPGSEQRGTPHLCGSRAPQAKNNPQFSMFRCRCRLKAAFGSKRHCKRAGPPNVRPN